MRGIDRGLLSRRGGNTVVEIKKQLNGAGLRQRMAPEKLEIGVEGGD
jgi:hypothetical protein